MRFMQIESVLETKNGLNRQKIGFSPARDQFLLFAHKIRQKNNETVLHVHLHFSNPRIYLRLCGYSIWSSPLKG